MGREEIFDFASSLASHPVIDLVSLGVGRVLEIHIADLTVLLFFDQVEEALLEGEARVDPEGIDQA